MQEEGKNKQIKRENEENRKNGGWDEEEKGKAKK
jgi:hypothetical protein